jgi:hypothetical protein
MKIVRVAVLVLVVGLLNVLVVASARGTLVGLMPPTVRPPIAEDQALALLAHFGRGLESQDGTLVWLVHENQLANCRPFLAALRENREAMQGRQVVALLFSETVTSEFLETILRSERVDDLVQISSMVDLSETSIPFRLRDIPVRRLNHLIQVGAASHDGSFTHAIQFVL